MTTCLHIHGLEFTTHLMSEACDSYGSRISTRPEGRSKFKTGPAFESYEEWDLRIKQVN